jgi:hypothetical protein
MDKGDTYKLTDTSCREIIVFGENNKVKQSYKYNKQKQRLFTYPFRITDVYVSSSPPPDIACMV